MSRVGHGIEKLIDLIAEDADPESGVQILFGSAAPGGDTGEQDDAPIGSLYMRTNGQLYTKIADTDATSDWQEKSGATVNSWRSELVRAATNENLTAGATDPTGWSDNEQGLAHTDFAIGEYVIGDVDGTPALWEVTAISAPNITLAAGTPALASGDTFNVRNYLPDSPAAQEAEALVLYDGASVIKVGDFNWDEADGINLPSGYTAGNGTVSSSDTVNSALQKLDGNQQDIQSASGLAQGDVDYSSFTGDSLADNQTSKQLFQRIETLLEQMRGVEVTPVTTLQTIDEVVVDDVRSCEWLVHAFEINNPDRVRQWRVYALHNGTAVADATNVKDSVDAKKSIGNFNASLAVDINGAGAAQTMRLRMSSNEVGGITVTARRIEVRQSVL